MMKVALARTSLLHTKVLNKFSKRIERGYYSSNNKGRSYISPAASYNMQERNRKPYKPKLMSYETEDHSSWRTMPTINTIFDTHSKSGIYERGPLSDVQPGGINIPGSISVLLSKNV